MRSGVPFVSRRLFPKYLVFDKLISIAKLSINSACMINMKKLPSSRLIRPSGPYVINHKSFHEILRNLGQPLIPDRLEKIPKLLDYWCGSVLFENRLIYEKPSEESLDRVRRLSSALQKVIDEYEGLDNYELQLLVSFLSDGYSDEKGLIPRLSEISADFDFTISKLKPLKMSLENSVALFARKLGRPKNTFEYLVVQDIAAIYEWLVNKEPTRIVDTYRDEGKEIGPFRTFSEFIWSSLNDGSLDGFETPYKRWSTFKNKERSPIIQNFLMSRYMGNGQN